MMLETDSGSRRHLFMIVGFLISLFGGFAVWGTLQRDISNNTGVRLAISDPAPVTADRAALLAKRRQVFQARKQMAIYGKKEQWNSAVRVADIFLRKIDDPTLRFLRAEALFRAGDIRGGEAMANALQSNSTISKADIALLRNDSPTALQEVEDAIRTTDVTQTSTLNANNVAWLAAMLPSAPAETWEKATRLSEQAVRVTETSENPSVADALALYTNTLGGVYYRAGRYEDAIKTLLKSERLHSDPFNAAFLALAYHEIHEEPRVAQWHDSLTRYLADTYATREGQEYRYQLLLLWREAETATQELHSLKAN